MHEQQCTAHLSQAVHAFVQHARAASVASRAYAAAGANQFEQWHLYWFGNEAAQRDWAAAEAAVCPAPVGQRLTLPDVFFLPSPCGRLRAQPMRQGRRLACLRLGRSVAMRLPSGSPHIEGRVRTCCNAFTPMKSRAVTLACIATYGQRPSLQTRSKKEVRERAMHQRY